VVRLLLQKYQNDQIKAKLRKILKATFFFVGRRLFGRTVKNHMSPTSEAMLGNVWNNLVS
jgi:hypothetical protein